jgi:hypothetical protein
MEDRSGLLGKIMNSALYWLLHPIDTLLLWKASYGGSQGAADVFAM